MSEKEGRTPRELPIFTKENWQRLVDEADFSQKRAHQELVALRRQQERRAAVLGLVLMLAGLSGTIVSIFAAGASPKLRQYFPPFGTYEQYAAKEDLAKAQQSMTLLGTQVKAIEKKYASLAVGRPTGEASDLTDVRATMKEIDARLARIENSISNNPERALTVPLLRKDVDTVQTRIERSESDIRTLAGAIESLRNLLLGGMGALVLAGIGLLANWLIGRKKTEPAPAP